MKIKVKNLGVLKQAEFELGDLTIICGENNSGKTYAAYALFGFLWNWREMLKVPISNDDADAFIQKSESKVSIDKYLKRHANILKKGCASYTKRLSRIFASSEERFANTTFEILIGKNDISIPKKFEQHIRIGESLRISIVKNLECEHLNISVVQEGEPDIPRGLIKKIISERIAELIFSSVLPNVFISSTERTGAAIFRKELDFARNRLLDQMKHDEKVDPLKLLFDAYPDYALPVTVNVDFTRRIEKMEKNKSFLVQKHPDILTDFSNIIGGKYIVKNDGVFFRPNKNRSIKLTMDESSSAVRSLLDIGFYLAHEAKPGDLLIVDEPELNLHPENQRRIARLFSRLVNVGMKVFITTHSDYIVKELNTLIMLKQNSSHLNRVADKWKYKHEELLDHQKIRLYVAEENLVMQEGNVRRSRCQTLTSADISQKQGIEVVSFDKSINEMNDIQEEILWGGDE